MTPNNYGDCEKNNNLNWPLNSCQKYKLLGLTSQLLEQYSTKNPAEILNCNIDIKSFSETDENGKTHWQLTLNETNYFERFFHEGYLLNSVKIKQGRFVFELNNDLNIIDHKFFKSNPKGEKRFEHYLANLTSPLLIIRTDTELHTMDVSFLKNNTEVWKKHSKSLEINQINLCD